MAQVINTNIASLNAQRNLNTSQGSLTTALQRLSTGLRINSAKDDAAGMAISTRMTSQINGLNQAVRNANDGISLAQTAEGGLSNATDLLQRMRELAVQSANATNSGLDRASLQQEVSQLRDELDRVANSTNFNGINLLDGSFSAQAFQVGANNTAADRIQINSIANVQSSKLGGGASGTASLTSGMVTTALTAGDLTINGFTVGTSASGTQAGQTAGSAWALAQAINAIGGQTGVTATANSTVATAMSYTGVAPTAAVDIAANSFTINGVAVGEIKAGVAFDATTVPPTAGGPTDVIAQAANVAEAINKVTSQSGVRASVDDAGLITLTSLNGNNIDLRATNSAGTFDAAELLADTGLDVAESTDAADVGLKIDVATATNFPVADAAGYQADSVRINGISLGYVDGATTVQGQAANVATAINKISSQSGVTATANAITGAITLTAADGRNITIEDGDGDAGAGTLGDSVTMLGLDLTANPNNATVGNGIYTGSVSLTSSNVNGIVIGGENDDYAGLGAFEGQVAADVTTSSNTISAVDISTALGAQSALSAIDGALSQINSARATMGATQNRFSAVVSNLMISSENLTASRSRIQDADFAAETASLTRAQILQQAGTAMLAQANSLPQNVLSLLQ